MRKCNYLDCPRASVDNEKGFCVACQNRPEKELCSGCGNKTEINLSSIFLNVIWKNKKNYLLAQKLWTKLPAHLQTELNPILPDLKLTAEEEKLLDEYEQLINDFLTNSGGKKYFIDRFYFCSACKQKLGEMEKEFIEQNPIIKTSEQRLEKAQSEAEKVAKKAEQELPTDQWKEIENQLGEELYGKGEEDSPNPPQREDNDGPNSPTAKTCAWCGKEIKGNGVFATSDRLTGQTSYYCSKTCQEGKGENKSDAKITRLEKEINSLKQEISGLKNSQTDSNLLNQKEQELKNKEKELEREKDNQKKKKQLSQNKNGLGRDLIITFSIVGVGVVLVFLILWLVRRRRYER